MTEPSLAARTTPKHHADSLASFPKPQKLSSGKRRPAVRLKSLLEELVERGLKPSQPTLFVLDGAKALVAGVKRVFGRFAVVQRCQVHKKRNVQAHVAERHRAELDRRLHEAYSETNYAAALGQLESTVRWLAKLSPDAAASLQEGMAETDRKSTRLNSSH